VVEEGVLVEMEMMMRVDWEVVVAAAVGVQEELWGARALPRAVAGVVKPLTWTRGASMWTC
jgi:hypothetical protein